MNAKHTPGEWLADNGVILADTGEPGRDVVAQVIVRRGEEERAEANARLISAAPDMLEALERAVALLDEKVGYPHGAAWMQDARAAIAKAKGEA